jgi:hypothetical protein
MSHSSYLIKNCSVKADEGACPKVWSELKPAFSDMVRHCDHCNKKVYLCETEEQIKFYSSVKFCIAVAAPQAITNVVENPPLTGYLLPAQRGLNQTTTSRWRSVILYRTFGAGPSCQGRRMNGNTTISLYS